MQYRIIEGNCVESMRGLESISIDSIVTDPPYELGFMGKAWDASGIANNVEMWREALRVLKPGGHLLAFSGSRTYHRMVCAIEDAGFEIRDQIMWVYGSGFPKSLDVSKAIDKAAGAEREAVGPMQSVADHNLPGTGAQFRNLNELVGARKMVPTATAPATDAARQWQGWGTALKPAHEPIVVARKPLIDTVAANVLAHGTGAVNVDGCRVESGGVTESSARAGGGAGHDAANKTGRKYGDGLGGVIAEAHPLGRWPANLIHDGSDEVFAAFPADAGRFFYCAKASRTDRNEGCEALPQQVVSTWGGDEDDLSPGKKSTLPKGNHHPTVKPTDLMRYLVRLVTPPGGIVLDPFTGSGSTGKAAMLESFRFVGCELSPEYAAIAERRIQNAIHERGLF